MSYTAIDPDGVLAMSAATMVASLELSGAAADVQRHVDRADDLVGGAPAVRSRGARIAEDLATLAGFAQDHALRYVDDVRPLLELREGGYWLPDLDNLGWVAEDSVAQNIDRIARSDEFGAGVLGVGEGLLQRYRNWSIHVPRPGAGAQRALQEIAGTLADVDRAADVRLATEVFRGQTYVNRGGLLVPESSVRSTLADDAMRGSRPRIDQLADEALRPTGPQLVQDPDLGRPPAWARTAGRGLTVVGAGLSLYDAGASQWEHDQRYHPEYTDTQRVASTGYSVATEGGGAVVGGIAGAKGGAALGAALGSVVPGLGTGVGAVAGGILGGAIGAFAGSKAGKAVGTSLREGAEAAWDWAFG